MAIVGILLVMDGPSASAATGRGRMAEMRRNGCCCVTLPAGGCCCEPAAPVATPARTVADGSSTGRRMTPVAPVRPGSPRATCQCRTYDPVAPGGQGERRPGAGRGDPVQDDSSGLPALDIILSSPRVPAVAPTARLPRSPLYLRTARLLI
jgi:hypothetical protein